MLVFSFSITFASFLIFVRTMFEHLFFIYLNCFLRIIFVRIIIFYYFIIPCPCRIRILFFLIFRIPPCRISVTVSVSVFVLPRRALLAEERIYYIFQFKDNLEFIYSHVGELLYFEGLLGKGSNIQSTSKKRIESGL